MHRACQPVENSLVKIEWLERWRFGFTEIHVAASLHVWSLSICLVWAGSTSSFTNGTHDSLELVLPRMALPKDQSRSALPLRSVKARELESCGREKCTCAPWTFPFKLVRTSSFLVTLYQ